MKVSPSIGRRKNCKTCRQVKRRGVLYVVCTNPRHKQRQG